METTVKDVFYFSHDYGSRNDPKLIKVLMRLGQAGKGVYWDLVEMLYEQDGYLLLSECESYAFALRTDCTLIESLINDFGLFEKDGTQFWSNAVLTRLDRRRTKSAKAKESADKRWGKAGPDANAMRTHSEGNAKKGKERKEEESSKEGATAATPLPAKKSKAEIANLLADPEHLQTVADSPLYKPHAFAAIITSLFPEANLDWYTREMQAKAPDTSMTAPSWRNWIINFMKNEAASKNGIVKVAPAAVKSKPFDKDDLFGFNTTAPYVAEPMPAYTTTAAGQYTGKIH